MPNLNGSIFDHCFDMDIGSFLFSAVLEERNNQSLCPAHLVKSCLKKAGLPFNGSESLRLHSHLFQRIFISPVNNGGKQQPQGQLSEEDTLTSQDYFECLLDAELGWFKYFNLMMPYIRVEIAARIVTALEEFCSSRLKKHSDTPLSLVVLLTSSVEMLLNVFFDVKSSQGSEEAQEEIESDLLQKLYKVCDELSVATSSCLNLLLQIICEYPLRADVKNDLTTLKRVVEMIGLTLLAVTSLKKESCLISHFTQLWMGRVHFSDQRCKEIKIAKFKQKHIAECQGDEIIFKHSELLTNETSSLSKSFTEYLLSSFKKQVSLASFFEIVNFFAESDNELQESFCNNLTLIIEEKSPLRLGHHHINRQFLFSQVEDLLTRVTSKDVSVCGIEEDFTATDINAFLEKVQPYVDRSQFSKSLIEKVLESKRCLSGVEDLEMVKKAVEEKWPGWRDLTSLAMKNTDFELWWNKGFLDLVTSEKKLLSTEENIKQVFHLLYGLSRQQPVMQDHVEKTMKLFVEMLAQLPCLLQEQIILSVSAQSTVVKKACAGDVPCEVAGDDNTMKSPDQARMDHNNQNSLQCLKSEENVAQEITSLLNKLTSSNVIQLTTQVLVLCLYSRQTVMMHALRMAISNKGQTEPIVQLLRQMRGMCIQTVGDLELTFIVTCLRDVLQSTQMDNKMEENLVKMLHMVTQGYSIVIEPHSRLTHHFFEGVLPMKEAMTCLLLPAMDKMMTVTSSQSLVDIANAPVPISATLKCLSCLFATIPIKQLHTLHGTVLLQMLTRICEQNWPLGVEEASQFGEKEESERYSVWREARTCVDCLVKRLLEEMPGDSSIQWLLQTSLHQGILSLALVYPLIKQCSDFKLSSIVALLAKEVLLDYNKSKSILLLLLQLSQTNDAACHDVVQVLDTLTTPMPIHWQLFTPLMAQVLSQSSPHDMARVCRVMKSLFSKCDDLVDGMELYLVSFIDWKSLQRETRLRLLCIQGLTDSLIWLVSVAKRATTIQIVSAASSYQSACQALVQVEEGSVSSADQEEILVATFAFCCSVISCVQDSSRTRQSLHVLTMTLLTNLATVFSTNSAKGKASSSQQPASKEEGADSQVQRLCDIVKDTDKASSRGKGWLSLQCFLSLRDVVCCIQDNSIQRQLLEQLKEIWKII